MSKIADMFRSVLPAPAAPQIQPGQPLPGNIPANAGATAPNNTLVPAAPETPKPPLADFAELWKTDPNYKAPSTAVLPNIDINKINAAAANLDFTKNIPPELAARVKVGGEDGMQAMMEAVNLAARNGFTVNTQATTRLIEEGAKTQQQKIAEMVAAEIKKQAIQSSLVQDNPALTNPAIAPIVDNVRNQFLVKYPKADESQVREHLNNYFNGLRDALGAPAAAAAAKSEAKKQGIGAYDFSQWG